MALRPLEAPVIEDDLVNLGHSQMLCSADLEVQHFKLRRAIMKTDDRLNRLAMLAVIASKDKRAAAIAAKMCLNIQEVCSGRSSTMNTGRNPDLTSESSKGRLVMMALLCTAHRKPTSFRLPEIVDRRLTPDSNICTNLKTALKHQNFNVPLFLVVSC